MGVYLDHAATSPMPDAVLAAYTDALGTVGNPASTHGHGQSASSVLEEARERIARALGCDAAETILTAGGTESINLAIKGLFWARNRDAARDTILIADGEHHATIEAAEWLRDRQGATLRVMPIDREAVLQPETLAETIAEVDPERVALVSFLWANNEVGSTLPVAELVEVAHRAGIPVHVDAVSALGQVPVDVRASGADAVSVSAHKIGGPVGVGALSVPRRVAIEPLMHGGSQQRGRSGTQDVAGAVAFAAALDRVMSTDTAVDPHHITRLAALRDRLVERVRDRVPDAVLNGAPPEPGRRLPGNAHFTFPGCQGDSLVFLLDQAGFSVSVGSACRAGVAETSHVLLAMGIPEETAIGALRFTLGEGITEANIDALGDALVTAVEAARAAGLSAL